MNKNPDSINADLEFLESNKISQWSGIPLWISGNHFTYSNGLIKKSLHFKPSELPNSIAKTLNYYKKLKWYEPTVGITEQERLSLLKQL